MKKLTQYAPPAIFLLIFIVLFSCKKPVDTLGSDIGNVEGIIGGKLWDTTVTAVTIREDSLRTDRTSSGTLGYYYDPVFGPTTSSLYTDFRLSQLYANDTLQYAVVDSAYLSLRYNVPSSYGNLNKYKGLLKFSVYKLTIPETLKVYSESEAGYYSHTNLSYDPTPIGSAYLVPNIYDSVKTGNVKEPAQLRIKLNKTFAQSLLSGPGSQGAFVSDDAFKTYFKGLYIKVDKVLEPDYGVLLHFLMPSIYSKISIYYHDSNQDSLKFDAPIKENSVWISNFEHNYALSQIPFSNDSASGTQNLYLQPMAGCRIKAYLPDLTFFKTHKQYAINKAELIFTVDQNYSANTLLPNQLTIFRADKDGKFYTLPDQTQFSTSTLDGFYTSAKQEYRFAITFHVKNIIDGKITNDPLILDYTERKASRADRVVFKGTDVPEGKVRFRIIYTELN